MIEQLFLMSLSGSVIVLVWWLVCRLTGERLSARWQYAALKLALLFLLVPVGPALRWAWERMGNLAVSTAPAQPMLPVIPEELPLLMVERPPLPAAQAPLVISPAAGKVWVALWAVCAMGVLVYKCAQFLRFRYCLKKGGLWEPARETRLLLLACQHKVGLLGNVDLRVSPAVPTPFATGLLRPVILLPDLEYDRRELQYILLHELTHLKRGDLWIRWFSMLASAVHWWNPVVYLLHRSLVERSEESCDERVVLAWPREERIDYGRVLLRTACSAPMPEGLTASISTTKRLQRRLSKMFHAKTLTKKQKLFSVGVILALLVCGSAAALAAQSPVAVQEAPAAPVETPVQPIAPMPAEPQTIPEPEPEPDPELPAPEPVPAEPEQPSLPVEDIPAIPQAYQNAVRGDTELILARGGILLPDDDPESYMEMNGVVYKLFESKGGDAETSGLILAEYEVGNWELLPDFKQETARETLVDGDYPRNSRGETYGHPTLRCYVGYEPDLCSAVGTEGERGYIRRADSAALPSLPEEECPHEFETPLYDQEGAVIGAFPVSCGGHFRGGMTVEEIKEALMS